MDKVEMDVETLQEIQSELRKLRVTNMELHGQLDAVKRLLGAIEVHLPTEQKMEYMPPVIAKINRAIEKAQKLIEEPAEAKAITGKKTK